MQNDNSKFKEDFKRRVYIYAINIINLVDSLDRKDFSLNIIAKQLIRSATSIGANIIEAQAGYSRKDFTNFMSHALKSANETKFWLGLIRDTKKGNKERINNLLNETIEIANILGSSILKLKNKK